MMARLEVISGTSSRSTVDAIGEKAEIALTAAAGIVEAGLKAAAPEDTGELRGSIKPTKVKRDRSSTSIDVYPQGKRKDGKRNAEVGFYHNYGVERTTGESQKASHWFDNAIDDSEDEALNTMEQVMSGALEDALLSTLDNII